MDPLLAKIFVIDDDESVRVSLRRLLQAAGYECVTFGSGTEFLQSLQNDPHACDADCCAIVDVRMPGIDGIELTRQLQYTRPALRVVLITASSDEHTKAASAALGVVLLSKPFDDVQLFAAITAPAVPAAPRARASSPQD